MARQIGKLSAVSIPRIKDTGLHSDGSGLYLRVAKGGGKFWIFRFMLHGKAREMGLGAVHALTLAEARIKAAECRRLLTEGVDPIEARNTKQTKLRLEAAKTKTFKQCAEAYIKAHEASWSNAKHRWQWENTLERFAYPAFGDVPVQDVDVMLVLKALEPIWETKTETAARLRGRIESILDWAHARELRNGDNPARWKGKLKNLLPAPSKIQKVEHLPALPYAEVASFMMKLPSQPSVAALALQLAILTATRTSEVLNATWSEFDLKKCVWTIPAKRMKMKREHRVPLSDAAIKLLQQLAGIKKGEIVFSGNKDKPLSNMAMLMLLRRMGHSDITVHGFRSSLRDWCAEQTNYAREVAEAALAHSLEDKVEAAYRRSDLFDKRRLLMNEWARYCTQPKAGRARVIKIRG